ncbi:hypothetical protein [Aggregatibacter kilianii]|jgi:hypothetical protein|uniref:hypothetical protein n=1 Tax=Aggregatibacter kilianii TaxID=2025884 RepID=UPI002045E4DF|nr:hypothetical protein [Aggregatibacter kilianii]DAI54589.1 MAG TPA: hypothetical protein [Inoviridae sp.]
MLKQMQTLKSKIVLGVGLVALSGVASAEGVLGNVSFDSIKSEVVTAAAALAVVYVAIAGAKIALGFIKRA